MRNTKQCVRGSEKRIQANVTFRFYYTKGLLFLHESNYYKNTLKSKPTECFFALIGYKFKISLETNDWKVNLKA